MFEAISCLIAAIMVLTSEDLDKIKNIIHSSMTEKFMNKIANKVAEIVDAKFEARITGHTEAINTLKTQVAELQERGREMERKIEEQEQNSRNLNLRIFGLPVSEGEDVKETVISLFSHKMKISIKGEEFKCYRIRAKNPGDKPPAVMVRFLNDNVRNAVIANRKQLKNSSIRIKEDLTKFRLALLDAAVKKFTFKNAWCVNGNIYIRFNNSVRRVSSLCEINNLGVN